MISSSLSLALDRAVPGGPCCSSIVNGEPTKARFNIAVYMKCIFIDYSNNKGML